MIRRALLTALLLVAGYAVFLRVVHVDWDTTQHLANGNRIKAEKFIYAPTDSFRTVIVGSSLAYRLNLDSFPARTINLGFAGRSIYDGMELIVRSSKRPELVLVETNILFRKLDQEFLDGLFTPGLYQLRRAMPMMREQNQPSGVLYGWLHDRVQKAETESPDTVDTATEAMLSRLKEEYAVLPDKEEQDQVVERLVRQVREVEATGAKVVFFEMPAHPIVMNSPLAALERGMVRKAFPDHAFLHVPQGSYWHTTDGLHLAKGDANRYSGWLRREAAMH